MAKRTGKKDPPLQDVKHDDSEVVQSIWESVSSLQRTMREPFPSHWDAFWYGALSVLITQISQDMGEKDVARILGKKKVKEFFEEHDAILEDMFMACHRIEDVEDLEDSEDVDNIEDMKELSKTLFKRFKP